MARATIFLGALPMDAGRKSFKSALWLIVVYLYSSYLYCDMICKKIELHSGVGVAMEDSISIVRHHTMCVMYFQMRPCETLAWTMLTSHKTCARNVTGSIARPCACWPSPVLTRNDPLLRQRQKWGHCSGTLGSLRADKSDGQ